MVDDSEEILRMLSTGMGPLLHWFPEDVSPSVLAMTLVGMANSEGGTVILGVSPRAGELVGIKAPEATYERIFQAVLLVDPILILPIPRLVSAQKPGMPGPVDLIQIFVPAGLPQVYCLDGRYLGREGTQTNPLSARRLYKLFHQRGTVQFESRVIP